MQKVFVFFLSSLCLLNFCEGCEIDDTCTSSEGYAGIIKRASNCEQFVQISRHSSVMPCGFDGRFPLTCCETEETFDETTTADVDETPEPSKTADYDYDVFKTTTPKPLTTTDFDKGFIEPSTREPATTTPNPLTTTDFDYGFFDDSLAVRIFTRPVVSQCTGFRKKPDIDVIVEIRIINGKLSDLGEFPHFAMIGYRKDDGGHSFDCGGALISDKFVLTAAHCCIRGRLPNIVRLGKVSKRTVLNKELIRTIISDFNRLRRARRSF